ncbi:hypothetical protein Q3G72_016572 [Acer saccharum]|nr:hypothetical protein Q3G72_016572 [Acer saccharum]
MAHNRKRSIMEDQPRKQSNLGHQQRMRDPIQQPRQPQRHEKALMHAQGHGMIPNFIPTCHFCGIDGHIRPNCFHYINMCRTKSMIEKRKARTRMHIHRKDKIHFNDPMTSKTLEPLTTRKKIVLPKWIRKEEPSYYCAIVSPIGSTNFNGLEPHHSLVPTTETSPITLKRLMRRKAQSITYRASPSSTPGLSMAHQGTGLPQECLLGRGTLSTKDPASQTRSIKDPAPLERLVRGRTWFNRGPTPSQQPG